MSDLVYVLLKSGRPYDRSIVEQSIQQRREQVARAEHSRAGKALSAPDKGEPSA
jgi:hypothetical protein